MGTHRKEWDCSVKLAALQADAARYRWLRKKTCIVSKQGFMNGDTYAAFEILDMPSPTYVAPRPDIELDAAIDAAIEQEQPPNTI